ncbi:PREDICTED: dentin sialophosphoprotein-like isoform X2 [Rhagoletis zephyria]|uniref:dentin sialophosphoprotein-like isoform X1 n=1 Tax=Rhagoletis zephyria TaxID=28612 RepID=UPI0008112437|nr:PREDICTED: dentin sialophosphoprotein-like isoform X1 [Rhagoletis zephyria]XP_017485172.1 PREDICTED: dentin sialophosphoprotein-like isoform X2 [Rhagoletis zephyria]
MKCELCALDRRDTIRYGEFLTKNRKGVHTNCLYLSSGLQQNGSEDEGFLGFLPKDIAAERARISKIQCCYCGKMYANIGCCEVRCYRNFHMICGIERGAMNQFLDTFRSFCDRHVRKVNTRPKPDEDCCICYEKIFNESRRFSSTKIIRAPCCRNGWFHKYCLQIFAKNAGYFFKCPLCNDSQKFKTSMCYWGVFVQDKDAEWELVPNAYAELMERPNVCGAEICQNEEGRGQSSDANPFQYCVTCGSVAIHLRCVPHRGNSFECDTCQRILNSDSGHESLTSQQQSVDNENECTETLDEDKNSEVDVCENNDEKLGKEKDSYEEILPPKMKSKNALRILDETEEASFSDDEDEVSIMGSSRRIPENKRYIIDAHNTEKSITEEILPPKMKRKNALRILDETEEASFSDDEDVLIMGSSRRIPENKRDIIDVHNTENSITDNVELNCSKDEQLSSSDDEAIFSEDEGLVDAFESPEMPHSSRVKENIGINEGIPSKSRQQRSENNTKTKGQQQDCTLHTSFITQRTRRKSLAVRPPSLYVEESADGDSSSSSYRSSRPYQVFQYDDDDSATKSATEDELHNTEDNTFCSSSYIESELGDHDESKAYSGQVLLDYFYALLLEVKQNKGVECANKKDEKIVDVNSEQPGCNRTQRRERGATREMVKNQATSALDVSCVANRTYIQKTTSHTTSVAVDQDNLSINTSIYVPPRYVKLESSNVSCIAQRTRRRSNKVDIIKEDEAEENNVFDVLKDCADTNDEQIIDSKAEQQRKLDKQEIRKNNKSETTNSLDVSCIANRTRRRSSLKMQNIRNRTSSLGYEETDSDDTVSTISANSADSFRPSDYQESAPRKSLRGADVIYEETELEEADVFDVSCIANRTRRKSVCLNKIKNLTASNSSHSSCPNDAASTSNTPRSSTESFKSSTYFGKSYEYANENYDDTNCQASASNSYQTNAAPTWPRASTSHYRSSRELSAEMTQKRKSRFDSPMPPKIPALTEDEKEPETHANVINHLHSVEENVEIFTTNSKEQPTSSTIMLSTDSSPERKLSDIIDITTPSPQTVPSDTISSAVVRRGDRTRIRPLRFLGNEDDSDSPKVTIVHSPMPNKINWSNLKEKTDAYIMPRYMRVNGKLKRISTKTFQMKQLQQATTYKTLDAQKHFARSYNLLLETPNDNHRRASSSRT